VRESPVPEREWPDVAGVIERSHAINAAVRAARERSEHIQLQDLVRHRPEAAVEVDSETDDVSWRGPRPRC
jgi:hypothetical protein